MTELSPWQALLQQLDEQRPTSLLYCSQTDQTALQHWCDHHDCLFSHIHHPDELEGLGRFDCVVIADWLEHSPAQAGIQSVARIRNLHTHAIWLLIPGLSKQPNPQLIALGFQRRHVFSREQNKDALECYGYNLDRYNHQREWNNPRFWANPENWGKYWW